MSSRTERGGERNKRISVPLTSGSTKPYPLNKRKSSKSINTRKKVTTARRGTVSTSNVALSQSLEKEINIFLLLLSSLFFSKYTY
jgi:hypothetical protein